MTDEYVECPPDCEGCAWEREVLCVHDREECAMCDWEPSPTKIPQKGCREYDAFTRRRIYSWGRGTIAWLKNRFNRRMRRLR